MFNSYYKANISTIWKLFRNVLSELLEAVFVLKMAHRPKGDNDLKTECLPDETPRTIQQIDQKWQPFGDSCGLLVKTRNSVLKEIIW